jgi:hypothetical protein
MRLEYVGCTRLSRVTTGVCGAHADIVVETTRKPVRS